MMNHRQVWRTKEKGLLWLGFRRKLGRVVPNKSSLEKNIVSNWLKVVVRACGRGREVLTRNKATARYFSRKDGFTLD